MNQRGTRRGQLTVEDLSLTYPATRRTPAVDALRGATLSIPAGQSVALLGPNGSGKSTLMKIVSGLIPADSGRVRVFGSSDLREIRRRISVVFQSNGLDPHLTVEENLRCEASLYGLSKSEAAEAIARELDRAGLIDRRHSFVKALSLGLARRVDLVRALLHHPKLIMLDEPTVGLDPVARENFLEEVERRRREDGLTILMSTHLTDEADRCDRCIFIHRGAIVADGEPSILRRRLGGRLVTVYGSAQPAESIQSIDGALTWTRIAGGWMARTDEEDDETIRAAAAELARRGRAFTIAPPTLADVFAHLTGAALNETHSTKMEDDWSIAQIASEHAGAGGEASA